MNTPPWDPEQSVTGWNASALQAFMMRFTTQPRDSAMPVLLDIQQDLVNLADLSNRSAKATTYAFLDAAWRGERDWTKDVTNITQSALRALRARRLKKDKICEPWHIDVLYGAFFGSGDREYLLPVIELIRSGRSPVLVDVAKWSFDSLCEQLDYFRAAASDA